MIRGGGRNILPKLLKCKSCCYSFSSASSPPSLRQASSSASHCTGLVKSRDYERYLTTLLLPKEGMLDFQTILRRLQHVRRSAFALRAFNAEVSSIQDSVTEKTIGLMRMQFWKDSIEAMFSTTASSLTVPKQPVAVELHDAIRKHSLSKDLLLRLISSRERFLSAEKPFENLEDVESYAHDAFTSLNYLILECISNDSSPDTVQQTSTSSLSLSSTTSGHVRHAANQLGKCEGLVTLLRAAPYNALQRRKVLLPLDLMSEHKISAESVIRNHESPSIVVETIASRAQEHLENCRFRANYLSANQKLAMLPAVLVDSYLERLARAKCDIFDEKLKRRDSMLPLALYWNRFRKSY